MQASSWMVYLRVLYQNLQEGIEEKQNIFSKTASIFTNTWKW
jgi:hypothetical protein